MLSPKRYGLAEIGATGQIATPRVLVPLILGIVLIGVFALYALRVPRPLLDLHLYRRATYASASIAMFCLGAALFGGMVLLPLYWQQVRFEGVLDTGLLTAPMGLGMRIMPIAGRLTDRYGGGPMASWAASTGQALRGRRSAVKRPAPTQLQTWAREISAVAASSIRLSIAAAPVPRSQASR